MTEAGAVCCTAAAACVYRDACDDDDDDDDGDDHGASLLNEWRKMWYDGGNIQAVRGANLKVKDGQPSEEQTYILRLSIKKFA